MADLEQVTDLARDAERAATPDFDAVVARARGQRRRQRVAVLAAVLAVVTGGALTATTLTDRSESAPPITQHRSSHHLTAQQRIWQALDRGETRFVTAADPGHVLIVREYCPRPHHCWWGSKITGVPDSTRPESQVHDRGASAGAHGFWIGGEGPFLGLDGRVHRTAMRSVPLSRASRPGPDAVFTMLNDNGFLVYEPTRHRYWGVRLPGVTQPPIQQLLLTDGGTIWRRQGFGATGNVVASSDDGGRTWSRHPLPDLPGGSSYGPMLWHAGTVGVPVYDAAGALSSLRVLDGSGWVVLPVTGTPLEGLSDRGSQGGVAALSDGRLFVVKGLMWQAARDSWRSWTELGSAPAGMRLTAARDVLLGVGDDQRTVFRYGVDGTWEVVE